MSDRTEPWDAAHGAKHLRALAGLRRVFLVMALLLTFPDLQAEVAVALPAPRDLRAPAGAPAAPGDGFEMQFDSAPVKPDAPVIAEWHRSVKPDESFTLTGARLTLHQGADAGRDTKVWVWAQTQAGGVLRQCKVWDVTPDMLMGTLPADVPYGVFLLWVANESGPGAPVVLNRAQPRWIGPLGNTVPPRTAATKRIFGRELSHQRGGELSWVFLQRPGSPSFEPLKTGRINPYEVEFTLPPNLTPGEHCLYLHNGHGGALGWGGPLNLTVEEPWRRGEFEVRVPPSGKDDTRALQDALAKSGARADGGTVRLDAGTYTTSEPLVLRDGVCLAGAGMDATRLVFAPRGKAPAMILADVSHVALRGLTLHETNPLNLPKGADNYGTIKGDHYSRAPGRGLELREVRISTDPFPRNGWRTLLTFRAAEVTGCEISTQFNLSGEDLWIHGNRFFGGPHEHSEGALAGGGLRCLVEGNHFQTPDWPERNGSRQYKELIPGRELVNRTWCKRVLSGGYGNEDWLLARNTGKDVAVDDNKGEIFLFHGVPWKFYIQVLSTTGRTVTLRDDGKIHGDADYLVDGHPPARSLRDLKNPWDRKRIDNPDGSMFAVVVHGTGLGQRRRIVAHTDQAITVAEPWRVPPAADSVLAVLPINQHVVVYQNRIEAFPSGYNLEWPSASTGVQFDGNCFESVAEANTFLRTCHAGMIGGTSTSPSYWNEFRDQKIEDLYYRGYDAIGWTWSDVDRDVVGALLLGNAVRGGSMVTDTARQKQWAGDLKMDRANEPANLRGRFTHRGQIFEGVTAQGSQIGLTASRATHGLFRKNTIRLADSPQSGEPTATQFSDGARVFTDQNSILMP